jgi:hypothetical protein
LLLFFSSLFFAFGTPDAASVRLLDCAHASDATHGTALSIALSRAVSTTVHHRRDIS